MLSLSRTSQEDLRALMVDLRKVKDKNLTKRFHRGLEKAAQTAKDAVRDAATSGGYLPQRGGLGAYVAGMRIRTKKRATATSVVIRLEGSVDSVSSTGHRKRRQAHHRKRRAAERRAARAAARKS